MASPNGQQVHGNTNNEGNANQNHETSQLLERPSQRRQERNVREGV